MLFSIFFCVSLYSNFLRLIDWIDKKNCLEIGAPITFRKKNLLLEQRRLAGVTLKLLSLLLLSLQIPISHLCQRLYFIFSQYLSNVLYIPPPFLSIPKSMPLSNTLFYQRVTITKFEMSQQRYSEWGMHSTTCIKKLNNFLEYYWQS